MNTRLISVFALVMALAFASCKPDDEDPTPPCTVNGTTVNIGSTAGGQHYVIVKPSPPETYWLFFDNTSMNFMIRRGDVFTGLITNEGGESCLDFSPNITPVATSVAYQSGVGYYGLYDDGHSVKFITHSYDNGIASISYIFQ